MAFKVFDAYGAASRPEATLRASGYLFLSRGIMRRAQRGKATHFQLQFDEETGRVAIKLLNVDDADFEDGVRPVTEETSGVSLNMLPLLRYYNLPIPSEKRMLPVAFEESLVIIDLMRCLAPPPPAPPPPPPPAPAPAPAPVAQSGRDDFDDDIPF
jgi:hypothetical protein